MKSVELHYRVDRRRISLLKFIFEAYEGLAVVTTRNSADGSIVLAASPQCVETVRELMNDLGRWIMIEAGGAD